MANNVINDATMHSFWRWLSIACSRCKPSIYLWQPTCRWLRTRVACRLADLPGSWRWREFLAVLTCTVVPWRMKRVSEHRIIFCCFTSINAIISWRLRMFLLHVFLSLNLHSSCLCFFPWAILPADGWFHGWLRNLTSYLMTETLHVLLTIQTVTVM